VAKSALDGKRVVVTRAPHQVKQLNTILEDYRAIPLPYPCIDMAPPDDVAAFDHALQEAATGNYDWLVLTSANAVLAIRQRLDTLGLSLADQAILSLATVGSSTARIAQELLGMTAAVTPEKFVAESLAEALQPVSGKHILLPQTDIARTVLQERLTAQGASVTTVGAYRTVIGSGGIDLSARLKHNQIDAITFTSASTVSNFLTRLASEGGSHHDLNGVCIACIGPITARTAVEHGLTVHVMPEEYTLPALVAALEQCFAANPSVSVSEEP
jgi:uroporphyrinogen-III synthase